jgi:uncharacterized protein
MRILIGFAVALLTGLTGIGGGSFTTPALVLIFGLPGAEAVGTAFVFSTIVRLTAAPFYVAAKQVHLRYLWLMLLGAVPGLVGGTWLLATFNARRANPVILIVIGAILIVSSALSFLHRNGRRLIRVDVPAWLPWLTLPIGVETGFSSAGAGAMGTILLLNCSDMPTAKVVGTDLAFGIILAAIGSVLHFGVGSISGSTLTALLIGGIPGVLAGSMLAPRVPSNKLRPAMFTLTFLLGLQLVWSGMHLAR